jgi:hypothetical protein
MAYQFYFSGAFLLPVLEHTISLYFPEHHLKVNKLLFIKSLGHCDIDLAVSVTTITLKQCFYAASS